MCIRDSSSNYYFEGERHDFWEFLYVDKGELDVRAGDVAVSYTHLDVYKRQLLIHIQQALDGVNGDAVQTGDVDILGLGPVSYTHLDVYKRQVDDAPVLAHKRGIRL